MIAPINDPASIHYAIARASTAEQWYDVNRQVHALLEEAIQVTARDALDTDPTIAWLNSLACVTHEVTQLHMLAAKMVLAGTR